MVPLAAIVVAVVCIQYDNAQPSTVPAGASENATPVVPGVVNVDATPQLVPSELASFFFFPNAKKIELSALGNRVTDGKLKSLVDATALSCVATLVASPESMPRNTTTTAQAALAPQFTEGMAALPVLSYNAKQAAEVPLLVDVSRVQLEGVLIVSVVTIDPVHSRSTSPGLCAGATAVSAPVPLVTVPAPTNVMVMLF